MPIDQGVLARPAAVAAARRESALKEGPERRPPPIATVTALGDDRAAGFAKG